LIQAPLFRFANPLNEPGRGNERLTRHTAKIQAIAAHQIALDQRNAPAESGCSCSGNQASGTGPYYHHVVNAFTLFHPDMLRSFEPCIHPIIPLLATSSMEQAQLLPGEYILYESNITRTVGEAV
jgi:hypothetical protein